MVKKILVWILIIISLLALLLRFSDKIAEVFLNIKQTSGISVLSLPSEAAVFLDENQIGATPFEAKDLKIGEHLVKIEKGAVSWQGRVKLTAGTTTIVNRDLASDSASAAGETLTLSRGKGLTIVSSPTEADVEIDGKSYGKTPLAVQPGAGEYNILLSRANYLKRSIQANLPADFNLAVAVDLGLSEADLTVIQTPVVVQTAEVTIKQTPTGFLRVRDKPSLNGKEIARVKPGDKLVLLEEQAAWYKVRLSNGTEGFVSAAYVEK